MVKRLIVAMLLVLGVGLFLPGCKGDSELRQRFRKEAIESRLDKFAKEMNLSKEQLVKFNEVKGKITSKMETTKKDREAFKDEMKAEMEKENPDVNMMADKIKGKIDIAAQNGKETVDLLKDLYNVLDENQKKVFVAKIHKKLDALEALQE